MVHRIGARRWPAQKTHFNILSLDIVELWWRKSWRTYNRVNTTAPDRVEEGHPTDSMKGRQLLSSVARWGVVIASRALDGARQGKSYRSTLSYKVPISNVCIKLSSKLTKRERERERDTDRPVVCFELSVKLAFQTCFVTSKAIVIVPYLLYEKIMFWSTQKPKQSSS